MGMTRRRIIASLGGGAVLLLAGCRALLSTQARLRYRITITCDTPDGVKSGTAVQEIYRNDPIEAIKPINIGTTEMTGDAVVLTVGGKHYFVDLTQCGSLLSSAIDIGNVSPAQAKGHGNSAEMLMAFKKANGVARMDGVHYMNMPYGGFGLDYFIDESDPATIKFIEFGSDYPDWSLISIVVVATDAEISRQAIKLLPWLLTITKDGVRRAENSNGRLMLQLKSLSDRFGPK